MILYVNDKNEIKDVDNTLDPSLIPFEVKDDENPFLGWNVAKICCYKAIIENGTVTSMSPYIDSKFIEIVDRLSKQIEELKAEVQSNE